MDTDDQDISIPVRRTACAYVPAVALVVSLANNIFTMLGISLVWQRRIVFLLVVSVPVVLAVAWILRKPKRGDSWLAHVSGTRGRRPGLAAVPTVRAAIGLVWVARALTPAMEKNPRVAVVEFRDGSPGQDKAYIAAGLSENLRKRLELMPGMIVLEAPDSATVFIDGPYGNGRTWWR